MPQDNNEVRFETVAGVARTGELPLVYVNSAQVRLSPYDIQMLFGQAGELTDKGEVSVSNIVNITMSPQHAKAFVKLLSQQVESYERLVGPIILLEPNPSAANEPQPPSSRSPGAARKKA